MIAQRVGAQVGDPVLAMALIEGAEEILAMLEPNSSPRMAGKIHSISRHPNGKMSMEIKGEAGKACILESSTNFVDWTPICVVRPDEDGNCGYEDVVAGKHQSRFYRVVER